MVSGLPFASFAAVDPATYKLTISGDGLANEISISIVSMSGSIVYREDYRNIQGNNLEVAVDKLVPGQYLLQMKTGERVQTIKFMKL